MNTKRQKLALSERQRRENIERIKHKRGLAYSRRTVNCKKHKQKTSVVIKVVEIKEHISIKQNAQRKPPAQK